MASKSILDSTRLDEAARAGWLYYVAGNTQDEIARKLGVSRQSAQRLVSLAVSERLIKVRLDHPIAHCMELGAKIREKFDLLSCEVVPSDPDSTSVTLGVAEAGAVEMERYLKFSRPLIITMGTGRTLRACVEQLPPMDCPQHRIVSLVGNMASDGSASAYNVIIRLADLVNSPHFPMPLPVIATTVKEREILQSQKPVHNILELASQTDVTFVGIGHVGDDAPLLQDGFVTRDELDALIKAGAAGEIVGWVYDHDGNIIKGLSNDRVASAPITQNPENPVFGIAIGPDKVAAILSAMKGKLINALITNELTAEKILRS